MFELNILLEIIIEVENNKEKDFSVPFSEAEKPWKKRNPAKAAATRCLHNLITLIVPKNARNLFEKKNYWGFVLCIPSSNPGL